MKSLKKPYVYDASLLLVAFIWGIAFVWVKDLLNAGIRPGFVLTLRYSVASIMILPFCWKDLRTITKKQLGMGLVVGVFLFLGMWTQTIGLSMTTPSNNAFITTTYVVITPLTAWFLLGQKPQKKIYLCAVMCIIGIYFLTRAPGERLSIGIGDALTILSAVLFAVQMTYMFQAGKFMNFRLLTFMTLSVSAVMGWAISGVSGTASLEGIARNQIILPLFLTALLPTVLSGFLQAWGQKHVAPGKAALILSLESFFASVISVWMGYEPFTTNLLIGGAIIVSATALAEVDFNIKKNAVIAEWEEG